ADKSLAKTGNIRKTLTRAQTGKVPAHDRAGLVVPGGRNAFIHWIYRCSVSLLCRPVPDASAPGRSLFRLWALCSSDHDSADYPAVSLAEPSRGHKCDLRSSSGCEELNHLDD